MQLVWFEKMTTHTHEATRAEAYTRKVDSFDSQRAKDRREFNLTFYSHTPLFYFRSPHPRYACLLRLLLSFSTAFLPLLGIGYAAVNQTPLKPNQDERRSARHAVRRGTWGRRRRRGRGAQSRRGIRHRAPPLQGRPDEGRTAAGALRVAEWCERRFLCMCIMVWWIGYECV